MAGQINDIGDNSICSSMSMQTQGTFSGDNAHLGNFEQRTAAIYDINVVQTRTIKYLEVPH